MSPAEAPLLTLAAGLAVHDAVQKVTEFTADLRWPNDLMLDGRKFCGILTEMQAEARNIRHVVVGIGLNVNQTKFAPDLQKIATSLSLVGGKTYYRLDLLARLLTAFDAYYNQLLREGPRPLVEAFKKTSSYARGKRVRIIGAREEYVGTTAGLDHAGCLLVRREDTGKTVAVLAGDVREA